MNLPNDPLFWFTMLAVLLSVLMVSQVVYEEITEKTQWCEERGVPVNWVEVSDGETLECRFPNGTTARLSEVVTDVKG